MQPPAVVVQSWPRLLRQAPFASQVPAQVSVSSAFLTAAQVPSVPPVAAARQDMHAVVQAVLQQTPSAQVSPAAHSNPGLHG